jgi:hypothetical protein
VQAADIPLSIDHYRYFAGWADKIHGKVSGGATQPSFCMPDHVIPCAQPAAIDNTHP